MRITHRMIANTVNFNLQSSLRRLEVYSNQLSTGKAFHKPSQNPVGVGRVMSYSASIDRNEQYRMNMNQSKGWLENSEDSLQNGLDVMQRIRELAIYGANESLTAEDRRAIAPEVVEFIDHLIGVANTESNGLYIFGGHQTAKEPFVRHNVYGIKEHYLEQSHQGYAAYDAGELQEGTANREIGLEFVVDGEKHSVTALSGGADTDVTFDNIKNAVEGHAKLGQYFSVDGNEDNMIISRITPGDFTIETVTAEAGTVIENLDEDTPVDVLSADQNIESLSGISPNSFLAGEYHILTEDTDAAYAVDTATRHYQYSQSGDNLVSSVEATTASHNQSVSFVVTGVDEEENEITFSYQYKEMDPGDGTIAADTGTFTVDLDNTEPFAIDIGENTYELTFNDDGEFTAGDRLVINTNAAIDNNADLVHLYRDGDTPSFFTYAFEDGTLNAGTYSFEFFSLDQDSGALLESSMDLTWGTGAFETGDDPDTPAAGFLIEQLGKGGTYADRVEKISTEGLQNGTYRFEETSYTAEDDFESDIKVGQQYLQGSVASILTGSAAPDQVQLSANNNDRNASILLEVRSVDYDTGLVRYEYTSHEYEMDGTHHRESGTFTLTLGGAPTQAVNIGNIAVDVDGLDNLLASDARGLEVGDRAVVDIRPAMNDGATYQRANISGEYRGGSSETRFIFNEDALQGSETDLRFFSLETFRRSPEHGRVYDGSITADDDTLELLRLPQNQEFKYDRSGFPVYYGDSEDRIQEISPHQEVIMNLHGEKAFGEYQDVFEAVYDVYWALIDNDREALGGEALGKMDRAIDDLLENISQVGARSNRVEAMESTLFNENIHLREVRSNIEDIDIALVITEFMMQENAYRAALSTANMMMQPSLVDYMR